MKESGPIIRQTARASSGMLMVISTKETGVMTRQMAMVYMCMLMVRGMRVTGRMICRMAAEWKPGVMAASTRENTRKDKSTGKASIFGTMVPNTMAIGMRIR